MTETPVATKAPPEARLAFRLTPELGQRLTARTVGGTLAELDRLNRC